MPSFNFIKPRRAILLFVVFMLFVVISAVYTLSTPIHGDGQYHEIIARQTLARGWPLPGNYQFVMSFSSDGSPIASPINYPQAVYLIYALLLKVGPWALQFSSPIFAGLTALIVFIFVRPLGGRVAILCSAAVIFFNLRRFIMSPIIEQPLLTSLMLAVLLFVLWLEKGRYRYAILTGLGAGVAMSLKQQGLLIGPIIFVSSLIILFLPRLLGGRKRFILGLLVIIFISSAVALPFQLEHLKRNGTIGYVPGAGTSGILNRLPIINTLIKNKYPADPASAAVANDRLGYRTAYYTPIDTIIAFFSFPNNYDNNSSAGFNKIALATISIILCGLGFWRTFRRYPIRSLVLLIALIMEIAFTHLTQSSIWQYHIFGIAIMGIFLMIGLSTIARATSRRDHLAPLYPLATSLIVFTLVLSFVRYCHVPNYGNAGRQDRESSRAYEQMGLFISEHLPSDTIIMAAGTNLVKYSPARRFWFSNGGGADIPEIFNSTDARRSYELMLQYPVKLLLIDERQLEKSGLYDSINLSGLNQTIESEVGRQLFSELYSVARPSGPALRLYQINPVTPDQLTSL